MSICVFLGPTLAQAEAAKLLDATYLPPARRGDIHAAVLDHGATVVGLVDGYFEQVPSAWHKEILWALSQGVAVWGAASIGALRAAELAQFGMQGVGRIYEGYASGTFPLCPGPFEDDDEVAVIHGPAETGYAASEAMVDIRVTLAAAAEAGVIPLAEAIAVAALAKGMFYKDRTWRAVLQAAEGADALAAWLPGNAVSQKALDAVALLRHLASGAEAPAPAFRFERTLIWEQAVEEAHRRRGV